MTESGHCEVLTTASNARDALSAVRQTSPDVVLLDPELPEADLGGLIDEMRKAVPTAYVVALTGSSDPKYLRRAIDAGVTAYLSAAAEPEELIQKLRLAAKGHVLVTGRMATYLSDLTRTLAATSKGSGSAGLTGREEQVVELATRGATNKQIADALVVTENTVKVHLRNIYRKLDVENRHQLTALTLQSGLNRRD